MPMISSPQVHLKNVDKTVEEVYQHCKMRQYQLNAGKVLSWWTVKRLRIINKFLKYREYRIGNERVNEKYNLGFKFISNDNFFLSEEDLRILDGFQRYSSGG